MTRTPSQLRLQLLGSPELVYRDAQLPPLQQKPLALLCYLALQPKPSSREALVSLLWEPGQTQSLRQALYLLRALPESETWLEVKGETVQVTLESDVLRFREMARAGRFGDALGCWGRARGAFLRGVEPKGATTFLEWCSAERDDLEEHYLSCLAGQARGLEAEGRSAEALEHLETLLLNDPVNEEVLRNVLRLLSACGQLDEALHRFETFRLLLRRELGLEPEPTTLELLARLQQGEATGDSQSFLLSEGGASTPPALFGRDPLLSEIGRHLEAGDATLLHGFGGVGKSALALATAQRWLTRGPVFWLKLGDSPPEVAFAAFSRTLGSEIPSPRAALPQCAHHLRGLIHRAGVSLLVLDDVWNSYTLGLVREALPAGFPLLVTSRQRQPGLRRVTVGRLPRLASLELLKRHATQHPHDPARLSPRHLDRDAANELCMLLGDHPFALRLAGATLRENALSVHDLVYRLRQAPHQLAGPGTKDTPGSVETLLELSLQPLDDRAYEAFLAFGGLFAPSATPELLAQVLGRDLNVLESALYTLLERGLAEHLSLPGHDGAAYRVHDLAYSYAKAHTPIRATTTLRAVIALVQRHKDDLSLLDLELPNLLGAGELASARSLSQELVVLMNLLCTRGSYFLARGHSPTSLGLLEKAYKAARTEGNLEDAHLLAGKLGDTYVNALGDAQGALELYRDAADMARQAGNTGRAAVYLSLSGSVLTQGGQEATALLDEALALARQTHDTLSLCTVLEQRGFVETSLGRYAQANLLFRESLELTHRLAPDTPTTEIRRRQFFALLNLGESEFMQGNIGEALALRNEALTLARTADNEIWIAHALYDLGLMVHAQSDRRETQARLAEALALYRKNQVRAYTERLEAFMLEHGYHVPHTN